ncbi:MAG: protein phosphatase 2C domain-containing protein [Lachnospiraceae bacterium]|nr:protein phosphatase 2C domain-containing protein [Clostridiales bacterium]MBR6851312.1 protein phosphatase 2C domain-containing protein [Lachnospiraceae bacterium]
MDFYSYTNKGGHEPNCDYQQVIEHDNKVLMVVCDGLNGLPSGDEAAKIIGDIAIASLIEGQEPSQACVTANAKFREMQFDNVNLRRAGATICVVRIADGICSWANVGDSHIYHFSESSLVHHSCDDTFAYQMFVRGECDYEALREIENRTGMNVCIGQKDTVEPHVEEFPIADSDGILVCSDGFWENVYETEMTIDFVKSFNAKDWARKMLLRAIQRGQFKGDNLTLITYIKMAG